MDRLMFPVRRRDHFMFPAAMFRTKDRPTHGGLDFTPVIVGEPEPFYAPEPGRILISSYVRETSGHNVMLLGDWTGIRWWGGHLSKRAVAVDARVERGALLGMTGNTGNVSGKGGKLPGCHLHLEAHFPAINVEIDPWAWLWDAPDLDGSVMPLAPSRAKAVELYPKFIDPKTDGPAPTKPTAPTAPLPIPEDDMTKTKLYRRASGEVALINPDAGLLWHVPNPEYLKLVEAVKSEVGLESMAQTQLDDVRFRLLCRITAEGHDPAVQQGFLSRIAGKK